MPDERQSKTLRRAELGRDAARLRSFLEPSCSFLEPSPSPATPLAAPPAPLSLGMQLCRCLLFSSRLDGDEAVRTLLPDEGARPAAGRTKAAVVASLLDGLNLTLGLRRAERLGCASTAQCARQLRRNVSKRGHLRWGSVFAAPAGNPAAGDPAGARDPVGELPGGGAGSLPLKMEICSGTGDWVAAQVDAPCDATPLKPTPPEVDPIRSHPSWIRPSWIHPSWIHHSWIHHSWIHHSWIHPAPPDATLTIRPSQSQSQSPIPILIPIRNPHP